MEFLAIVIVYCLSQLWDSAGALQHDNWIERLSRKSTDMFTSSAMRLGFLIAVPSLTILIVLALVDSMLLGLMMLIIYVGTLLFSLGRGDYGEDL